MKNIQQNREILLYRGERWLRGMSLEQVLQRFTSCPCFESSRFGFWVLTHVLAYQLRVCMQLPAHQSPSVAITGLSFKNTVKSSFVKFSWGSAHSDYLCNPCNVRLASRYWEKFGQGLYLYWFPYWLTFLYQNILQQVTLNQIFSSSFLPR